MFQIKERKKIRVPDSFFILPFFLALKFERFQFFPIKLIFLNFKSWLDEIKESIYSFEKLGN
jgi:hypothetical protein